MKVSIRTGHIVNQAQGMPKKCELALEANRQAFASLLLLEEGREG